MKRIDRVGKTYGQLTVIAYAGRSSDGHARWKCQCSCGNVIVVLAKCLASGETTTCRVLPTNYAEHLRDGTTVIHLHHKGEVVKCLIDTVDYPLVKDYRWSADRKCCTKYAVTNVKNSIGRVSKFMHSLLLPDAEEVDHKNHDGLDNRRTNLRPASSGQNKANRRKGLGTSSKYKGVHWNKSNGSCGSGRGWSARIKVKGRMIYIGSYANEETAALAYDIAAIKHFDEFAHLNILQNPYQTISTAIAA